MVIDKAREEVYQLHLIDPNGPLEAHLPVPTTEPNRNPSKWGMPLLELCHKFILAEQKGLNKIQEIQQKTEMPNFFFKASIKHFDCNNKTWNSYVCVLGGRMCVCTRAPMHTQSCLTLCSPMARILEWVAIFPTQGLNPCLLRGQVPPGKPLETGGVGSNCSHQIITWASKMVGEKQEPGNSESVGFAEQKNQEMLKLWWPTSFS